MVSMAHVYHWQDRAGYTATGLSPEEQKAILDALSQAIANCDIAAIEEGLGNASWSNCGSGG